MSTVAATLSDAERLFEKETERLRGEMSHAQEAARNATADRDRALQEVSGLQKEKSDLIEENARLKVESQRIKDSLAEHRKNVEASLNKREAEANQTLEKSTAVQDQLTKQAQANRQLRSQIDGIKHTFQDELAAIDKRVADLLKKTREALQAIPDASS